MEILNKNDNRVFTISDRRPRGVTQRDVAQASGMQETKYKMLETLTFDELYAVAKVLDIPKSDLLCKQP